MKIYKYLILISFLIISTLFIYMFYDNNSFYFSKQNAQSLENRFTPILNELNNKNIRTDDNYSIYIANFSEVSNIKTPIKDNNKSIVWLGGYSRLNLNIIKEYDYVFASSPLLHNMLKANNIKSYYVPLGDFSKNIIKKENNNEILFGIIGNPLFIKDILDERKIKYKQYQKTHEDEIINDLDKLDAVFVENTSFYEKTLDLHPVFFKIAHNKIPIITRWGWPKIEENINMFNDFINFYIQKNDLNILIDEIIANNDVIQNRSEFLYNLIEKEFSINSIANRIIHILETNSDYDTKIDDNSINFDLSVSVGHIASGDFWLVKDLSEYFIKHNFISYMSFFNSYYKYKTDINITVSGSLYTPKDVDIAKTNILYIAYPLFWDNGKVEFVKNIEEYIEEIIKTSSRYDAIIVASKPLNDELNKRGIKSYFIPQYTNTDRFYPSFFEEYKSEVLFVGANTFYRKAPNILLSANLPITIYGPSYPDGISKGDYLDNRVLGKYYASAKIVLNDTREGMIKHGFISNRIFDASACGALVISDYMKEIEEIYGDSVPMWKTSEELVELVKYYLDPKNEAERRRKAKKAQEITLKNFTLEIAGQKFINVIEDIKKQRNLN